VAYPRPPLGDIIVATREEALVGIVGVGGGIVGSNISIVMFCVFHEAVIVKPVVKDQDMVAWCKENVSTSHFTPSDFVADLLKGMSEAVGDANLEVSCPVSTTIGA
jgi:hypothetical protein